MIFGTFLLLKVYNITIQYR